MKDRHHPVKLCRFMLVEALVYMALFAIVTGMATHFFLDTMSTSRNLREAGEDILRVGRFGDLWRQDVRHGRFVLPSNGPSPGTLCRIKREDGAVITYRTIDDTLTRETSDNKLTVLKRVDSCALEKMQGSVDAWRLDIELQPRKHPADTRPLFSFIGARTAERESARGLQPVSPRVGTPRRQTSSDGLKAVGTREILIGVPHGDAP